VICAHAEQWVYPPQKREKEALSTLSKQGKKWSEKTLTIARTFVTIMDNHRGF